MFEYSIVIYLTLYVRQLVEIFSDSFFLETQVNEIPKNIWYVIVHSTYTCLTDFVRSIAEIVRDVAILVNSYKLKK